MPIARGAKGVPGVLAIPGRVKALGGAGRQFEHSFLRGRPFRSRPFATTSMFVAGITKDGSGTPIGSCIVQLFRTWDDVFIGETVSDGSGNYTLRASGSGTFYVVAYLPGSPDLAGTTVNTLIPLISA